VTPGPVLTQPAEYLFDLLFTDAVLSPVPQVHNDQNLRVNRHHPLAI
jgi:hypothetical protein